MSGFAANDWRIKAALQQPHTRFLQKPFTFDDGIRQVSELLAQTRPS